MPCKKASGGFYLRKRFRFIKFDENRSLAMTDLIDLLMSRFLSVGMLQSKTEKKRLAESFNNQLLQKAGSILSDSIRPIAPGVSDPAPQLPTLNIHLPEPTDTTFPSYPLAIH